jgi:hypothetical protein
VNGTAVPDNVTLRPFSTTFDGYKFGRAGGWAFQRVVTRLKITGLCLAASPTRTDERLRLFHVAAHDSLGVLTAVRQIALVGVKRRLDFVLRFIL